MFFSSAPRGNRVLHNQDGFFSFARELRTERLDQHLLLAEDFFHPERYTHGAQAENNRLRTGPRLAGRVFARHVQCVAEPDQ